MEIIKKSQSLEPLPRNPPPPKGDEVKETKPIPKPNQEAATGEPRNPPPPKNKSEDIKKETPKQPITQQPINKNIVNMQGAIIQLNEELNAQLELYNEKKYNTTTSLFNRFLNSSIKTKNDILKGIGNIKNIGGKNIPIPDGKWGDKTTVALNNILEFMSAMKEISVKFNIPLMFDKSDISKLKELISLKGHGINEIKGNINEVSDNISNILYKVNDSIAKFNDSVNNNFKDNTTPIKEVNYLSNLNDASSMAINQREKLQGISLKIKQDISNNKSADIELPINKLTDIKNIKEIFSGEKLIGSDNNLINQFLNYLSNGIKNNQITILNKQDTGY